MSNSRDKRTFKFADEDYAVIRPKIEQVKEANEIRAKVFNDALQGGDLLRDQLDNELRKRELWNDEREKQYQALRKKVVDGEYSLTKGGIKLSEAKDIALEMARSRAEMISMLSGRSELDSITCEGKADAARFNFLFSRCLVYNTTEEKFIKPFGHREQLRKSRYNLWTEDKNGAVISKVNGLDFFEGTISLDTTSLSNPVQFMSGRVQSKKTPPSITHGFEAFMENRLL